MTIEQHTIRLRRPWHRSIADTEPVKVDVPDVHAADVDTPGKEPATPDGSVPVCYRRSFNCPTGLTEMDDVHLMITGYSGMRAKVILNNELLHTGELADATFPIFVDLRKSLQPSNQLVIEILGSPGQAAILSGEVNLRIQSDSPG